MCTSDAQRVEVSVVRVSIVQYSHVGVLRVTRVQFVLLEFVYFCGYRVQCRVVIYWTMLYICTRAVTYIAHQLYS